jgi:hypothetical protein
VGHISRYSGLVRVEASQDMIFQSDLKTSRDTAQMMHVASSWRLHRDQIEDGHADTMVTSEPAILICCFFYIRPYEYFSLF